MREVGAHVFSEQRRRFRIDFPTEKVTPDDSVNHVSQKYHEHELVI